MNQDNLYLPPVTRTSTLAIISLISGIASWSVLPLVSAIVAVVTGHIAQNEIKKSGNTVTGKGMATAGLILGYLSLAGGICAFCVFFVFPFFGFSLLTIPIFSIPFLSTSVPTY
jgi:hypothetical protein